MFVVVMALQMTVAMLMYYRVVPMNVFMFLGEEQHQRDRNDPSRERLHPGEGLTEYAHRKEHAEERSR